MTIMADNEQKIEAIYVATLMVRKMIERGECELFFEDGTKVKPEEYFWDESQFPIEVVINGKRTEVKKEEIDMKEFKRKYNL